MPRPQKIGLDYFPLDTIMDDKLELIEAKYDIIGYAIIIKLWAKIYKNSYWCKWTENEKLLFRKNNNIEINLLNEVVNQAIEWDIFSLDKYKQYEILTSNGIQKRYLFAIKERKNQEFIEEYCIFDVNEYINSVKSKINAVKVPLNPYIILKETILNNIKEKEKKESDKSLISLFNSFWKLYPKKVDKKKSQDKYIKLLTKNKSLHPMIINALNKQIDWRNKADEKTFIPEWKNPTTWLNGECWNDEVNKTEINTQNQYRKMDEK